MADYKPFANTVVVVGEPTLKEIEPKSGPQAGQKVSVVSFRAYHPTFVKQPDGSFKRGDAEFFDIQYYGKEGGAKRIKEGLKEGMTLEVRGEVTEKSYTGKDGQQKTAKEVTAKGIAVSLNQPGLTISFEPKKEKEVKGQER